MKKYLDINTQILTKSEQATFKNIDQLVLIQHSIEERNKIQQEILLNFKKVIGDTLDKENKSLFDLIGLDWRHVKYIFDGKTDNQIINIISEICLKYGYKLEIKFIKIKDEDK